MQKKIDEILNAKPRILSRFDESLFVETPLYRSKKVHRPIYINLPLFYKLFEVSETLDFNTIAALLAKGFSTTIEKAAGTDEVVGMAYVDKQYDPLDLSLSGNLGSGRAYYAGRYFNIKGEKTPLARSTKKQYSDGFLEMERAIWETTVSNSLQGSFTNGLNTVLAIFDLDEYCDVDWRDKPVRRAKMIRVDQGGELDRVTHNFYLKTPLKAEALKQVAKNYGQLEADKFIERIVHGTWSAGNISLGGHLIDLDTVGAVIGRGPAYSSTRWHHENRFGYEYKGQLKIIESLVADKNINIDDVSYAELEDILITTKTDQTRRGFIKLMGLEKVSDYILEHHFETLDALFEIFIELSKKISFKDGGLLTKTLTSSTLHLFDFSRFMRLYPLFKSDGNNNEESALDLLINPQENFSEVSHALDDIEKTYIDKVYEAIEECVVTSDFEYKMYLLALKNFIKHYDNLMDLCVDQTNIASKDIALSAYRYNEDRHYMMPYFTASYHIAKTIRSDASEVTQHKIESLIKSNNRGDDDCHFLNARLYKEGVFYTQIINETTSRFMFDFWTTPDDHMKNITLCLEGIDIKGAVSGTRFSSDPMDLTNLSNIVLDKIALHVPRIHVYTQYEDNKVVHFSDLTLEG